MLKLKVLALSVNNLTDARYFAAYMVDWIGFNVNPASANYVNPENLAEILGWVEGPRYILQGVEWNEESPKLIQAAESKIEAVMLEKESAQFKDLLVFSHRKDRLGDMNVFEDLDSFNNSGLDPEYAFISYRGEVSLVRQLMALPNPPGLCLSGGDEQAVGLKAFDELDEVFDLLYD